MVLTVADSRGCLLACSSREVRGRRDSVRPGVLAIGAACGIATGTITAGAVESCRGSSWNDGAAGADESTVRPPLDG